jgi:hypothetical protein
LRKAGDEIFGITVLQPSIAASNSSLPLFSYFSQILIALDWRMTAGPCERTRGSGPPNRNVHFLAWTIILQVVQTQLSVIILLLQTYRVSTLFMLGRRCMSRCRHVLDMQKRALRLRHPLPKP